MLWQVQIIHLRKEPPMSSDPFTAAAVVFYLLLIPVLLRGLYRSWRARVCRRRLTRHWQTLPSPWRTYETQRQRFLDAEAQQGRPHASRGAS